MEKCYAPFPSSRKAKRAWPKGACDSTLGWGWDQRARLVSRRHLAQTFDLLARGCSAALTTIVSVRTRAHTANATSLYSPVTAQHRIDVALAAPRARTHPVLRLARYLIPTHLNMDNKGPTGSVRLSYASTPGGGVGAKSEDGTRCVVAGKSFACALADTLDNFRI